MKIFSVILLCWCVSAQAHKASDSYLALTLTNAHVKGQWDIALRDLDNSLSLDLNGDGNITWGELQQRQQAIQSYAFSQLTLSSQQPCPIQPIDLLVDEHSDGHYAVLMFEAHCPKQPENLTIAYQLFFDSDPQHRGLLRLTRNAQSESAVFSPEHPQQSFTHSKTQTAWQELLSFGYEGIQHIWAGYDHLLFLISLLLPAALLRQQKQWQPNNHFVQVFWEVFTIVGAFTIAHSITLSLAVLGYVSLPSRWVESAIAASVALAALNNLFPVFSSHRTLIAFSFGLIHGLGIASVLLAIDLPESKHLLSLVGFNLGVEAGQLSIVVLILPWIILLSRYRLYIPIVIKAGSFSIIVLALLWLAERSLDFQYQ